MRNLKAQISEFGGRNEAERRDAETNGNEEGVYPLVSQNKKTKRNIKPCREFWEKNNRYRVLASQMNLKTRNS